MNIFDQIKSKGSTFIIAELSANHNQNIETAIKTIKAAKESGADAIKLQTYTPDTMTIKSDKEWFKINQGTIWDGTTLYELYEKAYTPWEWHEELFETAKEVGIIAFSTPFDKTSVDFLENFNMPAYKIASFEITDIPLIEYIASKGKPIIMSTGIATLKDIEEAVDACKRVKNNQIALLKCTSSYPAPLDEANLLTIPELKNKFDVLVGLSDHTMGDIAATTAVALGAGIVEKHFILDRSIGGPDSSFSMQPEEFKKMTDSIRLVEKTLGKATFELTPKAMKNKVFSRSLFAVEDIKEGEVLSEKNIRSIRPNIGLHPKHYNEILGKKAKAGITKGTPLSFDLIE